MAGYDLPRVPIPSSKTFDKDFVAWATSMQQQLQAVIQTNLAASGNFIEVAEGQNIVTSVSSESTPADAICLISQVINALKEKNIMPAKKGK